MPDPNVLRRAIPDDLLALIGEIAHAPALLQQLLDGGTPRSARVNGGGMLIPLGTGHDWHMKGTRARSALMDALGVPKLWKGAATTHASGPDDVLKTATRQITDDSLGTLVSSHKGAFVVYPVRDGVVEIAIEGVCGHCPVAEIMMHTHFEHLLRRRCLQLAGVRRIDE